LSRYLQELYDQAVDIEVISQCVKLLRRQTRHAPCVRIDVASS
jgi:hypothetical protein